MKRIKTTGILFTHHFYLQSHMTSYGSLLQISFRTGFSGDVLCTWKFDGEYPSLIARGKDTVYIPLILRISICHERAASQGFYITVRRASHRIPRFYYYSVSDRCGIYYRYRNMQYTEIT